MIKLEKPCVGINMFYFSKKPYDSGTYKTLHLCKISPRCYTVNILLDNSVKVLWALYGRIQLQTYRAPIGAVFVPCLRIQLPGSCNRMYGADDRYIKLSSSCMRRYGAYDPRHEKYGNREADQRLCFRYTKSTNPLLPKSEISSY